MNNPVPETLLEPLSRLVGERMGLHFPPERWPDLARGIRSAARERGFQDANECARWLLSAPFRDGRLELLARHLTVGETYFLRDRAVFNFLAQQILPELISSRQPSERRLRIWSAGCATGEEPYSIAILLRQAIADVEGWNVTILGTDINPWFLQRAAEGVYTDWSFRDLPGEFRTRYFTAEGKGRYRILPKLQQMVTFAVLNLAEDSYPSLWSNTNAMDVIFCRNVLMYFTPAQAQKAAGNLHRCLVDGGWLIVSASEASQTLFSGFKAMHTAGATFYRKQSCAAGFHPALPAPAREALPLWPETAYQPPPSEGLQVTREAWPGEAIAGGAAPDGDTVGTLAATRDSSNQPAAEQRASSDDPESTAAMIVLARASANQGRLAEALAWCEKAVAADKLNPACHYLRAAILLECGATREAMKCLRQTLYLDPRFVLAHVGLGTHARREGRLQESTKHFENALSLLRGYRPEEFVPEGEGMTARRMEEVLQATLRSEEAG